jgi:hypothetical protein
MVITPRVDDSISISFELSSFAISVKLAAVILASLILCVVSMVITPRM